MCVRAFARARACGRERREVPRRLARRVLVCGNANRRDDVALMSRSRGPRGPECASSDVAGVGDRAQGEMCIRVTRVY